METYTLEGVLRTVSPLHITSAGTPARYVPDTGTVQRGKLKIGFPLTLTQQLRLFMGSEVASEDEEGARYRTPWDYVPIVSASSLRGLLRRGAARVIEDHMIHTLGTRPTYEIYQGLHCGAVSGKPDGRPPSTDEIRQARHHVFYGLFGGGPRMHQGALRVSDALPVLESLIDAGYVPATFSESALVGVRPYDLVQVRPVLRKDDVMGNAGDALIAADVIADFEQRYTDKRQEIILSAVKKAKGKEEDNGGEGGEDGERGVRALSYRQDIVPGVPFYFHATLRGTPAQVGMLLAALDHRLPQGIGGRASHEYGLLSGSLSVRAGATAQAQPVLQVQRGAVELLATSAPYMDAMADAVAALTLNDISQYLVPGEA